MIIYMWEFPASFGSNMLPEIPSWAIPDPWRYQPHPKDHPAFDHDHNPFWGRSMLLGAFIASGGDW